MVMESSDLDTYPSRFGALCDLVDHIARGPRALVPRKADSGEWLESFLKMSQHVAASGPYEARSLYVVPNLLAPAGLLPIVRTLVWERAGDRRRCRNEMPDWPDLDVALHEVRADLLPELDTAVKRLDASFGGLDFPVAGLDLQRLYEVGEDADGQMEIALPRKPGESRRLWLKRAADYSIELWWTEGLIPSVEAALQEVWDGLGSTAKGERKTAEFIERYSITPEEYAPLTVRRPE